MSGRSLPIQWAEQRAAQLRADANELRSAYRQPYMREPCVWLAATLDEAADLLERRIADARTVFVEELRPAIVRQSDQEK